MMDILLSVSWWSALIFNLMVYLFTHWLFGPFVYFVCDSCLQGPILLKCWGTNKDSYIIKCWFDCRHNGHQPLTMHSKIRQQERQKIDWKKEVNRDSGTWGTITNGLTFFVTGVPSERQCTNESWRVISHVLRSLYEVQWLMPSVRTGPNTLCKHFSSFSALFPFPSLLLPHEHVSTENLTIF